MCEHVNTRAASTQHGAAGRSEAEGVHPSSPPIETRTPTTHTIPISFLAHISNDLPSPTVFTITYHHYSLLCQGQRPAMAYLVSTSITPSEELVELAHSSASTRQALSAGSTARASVNHF
eukprot:RCo052346